MAMGIASVLVGFWLTYKWLYRRRAFERYIRIRDGIGGVWSLRLFSIGNISLFLCLAFLLFYNRNSDYEILYDIGTVFLWSMISGWALGFIVLALTICGPIDMLWRRKRMSVIDKSIWNNGGKDYIKYEDWWKYAYAYGEWHSKAKAIPFWTWYKRQIWKPSFWIARHHDMYFRVELMDKYGY